MVATLLKNRLLEGFARVAAEHPELDFGISTPEVNAAWDRLNLEVVNYHKNTNLLSDVHRAFREWERAIVEAHQPAEVKLF